MTSYATKLLDVLLFTFSDKDGVYSDLSALKSASGVSEQAWKDATTYTAQALTNLCNYKSFGHSKFIPRCSTADFEAIIKASPNADKAHPLWVEVGHELANYCSYSSAV
jgi:dipeptidyl-peptidase III